MCRNNVPVRNLLRAKGIQVPISCVMCVGDVEHLLHLFFDCDFAKACWQKMVLSYNMWEIESAPAWLLDKLGIENGENLIKIVTILWGIWWARNKRFWEGKVITPDVVMSCSSKQVEDWREAQKRKCHSTNSGQNIANRQEMKWVAPVQGTLKNQCGCICN